MCGIVGVINLNEDISFCDNLIKSLCQKLISRGPDASKTWISTHALIGHTRLIVVDPIGGNQPMIKYKNNTTYVISYNGELYNTIELRNELTALGHNFSSNSDTEVLLTSFIEWGNSCLEKLNGIFAFAIWNEKENSLFLARDRFGVKPLFYTLHNSSIIFASELKAILEYPGIRALIDNDGLNEIFTLGPSRTPSSGVFKNIYELKPASYLTYNQNGLKVNKYWWLKSVRHTDPLDITILKLRKLLIDSIERQLVADVPVCTFLSGGLDSSIITAIAATKFLESDNRILNTYSIDYKDNDLFFEANDFQPNSDEAWIKIVSDKFKTNHHTIKFDTLDLISTLEAAMTSRDLPGMADIDSSLWLFCREVKKDAVVALSGECADEIFGGYPWFHREDLLNCKTFPWMIELDKRILLLSNDIINDIDPYQYVKRRYDETIAEVPYLDIEDSLDKRRREMFFINYNWFMATLLERKDRMSMAHGLEVRVPFCDHRLVEYIWNIPWDMKMLDGREKGLLRRAMDGILPDEILTRKKSPYPKTHNPDYERATKEWMLDILNDNNSPIIPYINKTKILELIRANTSDKNPWFGQLMALPQMLGYLIQVNLWMKRFGVLWSK